ncbi:MAG: hypothetical protein J6P83_06420 [Bacteroidales bacterium]|nr:hypothetical protein [Bacteroidales bacterium]
MKSKLLLLLLSTILIFPSCGITNRLSIGDSRYLDVYCIQQLKDDAILAVYAEEDNNNAVKIITNGKHYSNWQRIRGEFKCVGFWTYETSESIISTIPVFVKSSD